MKKILIANRGEIALRIMKTCREMGIITVAVYSEADRNAPFVKYADQAFLLGPPPSSQSYLLKEKIIDLCLKHHVDGVHPGYGFLSENAEFAELAEKNNITFIGPKSHAMNLMGSKLAAKAAVKKFGIPMVPGTDEAVEDPEEALRIAKEIGFPLLIKASAGGGGKGMRVVNEASELKEQMERAISEAISSFGDGAVFIEKYVTSPRHIEIQILADTHGNIVHLFERECSIQRRHQKVVEEAPSAVLTPELRHAMGESAKDVAKSCDYVGAGTVEFLLDENLNYYFLEMNTRLQVEHPVTEMITGVDLVREQILVARGEKLSFTQEDLKINGHALEVRVYAEDPENDFLPDIGTLKRYVRPQGTGIRVDDGFEEGMEIPIYYDPMISKLITHATDRNNCISRMTRAIDEYEINGIKTTLPFCRYAINHEAFVSGNFDTHFVKNHFSPKDLKPNSDELKRKAAIFMAYLSKNKKARGSENNDSPKSETPTSKWAKNRKEY